MNPNPTENVLAEVAAERCRQDAKWGQQDHHPFVWLGIIMEEVGETARAANEAHWNGDDWTKYRQEAIQSAAVLVAMIESLDRNGHPAPSPERMNHDNGTAGIAGQGVVTGQPGH